MDLRAGVTVALLALAGCGDLPAGSDRAPPSSLRRMWPTTGAVVRSPRPRVRWRGGAPGEPSRVVFCADRGCTQVLDAVESTTGDAQPARSLPVGVVFWSVHERPRDGGARPYATAGWFLVPRGARDVPARASQSSWWRAHTDADGDGRWDYVDIDGQWFARGATERRAVLSELGLIPAYNAGDMDGDGFADMIGGDPLRNEQRGVALAYRGPLREGGNAPWGSVFPSTMPDTQCAAVPSVTGDFNGDGSRDVAVSCPLAEGVRSVVSVHLSTESTLTEAAQRLFVNDGRPQGDRADQGLRALLAEDVDGDGYDDLVVGAFGWRCDRLPVTDHCSDHGYTALYRGGDGGVSATRWARTRGAHEQDGRYVALTDVDGEGHRQLVVWYDLAFRIHELRGGELVETGQIPLARFNPNDWSNLFAADFDGDGRDEFVFVTNYTPPFPVRGVYLRREPTGSWSVIPLDDVPAPWADRGQGGIADVNGDGYPDRVAYARSINAPSAVFAWYGGPSGLSPRVQRVTP